ncbi:hypothetical protein [Paenibacillus sophorae]|uniref:Uncharacterized protein n=1 Tax=Paenibacillus sophorae TaxID=1333845 RepID=A0ABX8HF51_9BACL|nr:hypothetical protein [Paenibacillus sophorae]QWU16347.1 hypothetical protein KP014_03520 [Paenibacillus sophorae]
MLIIERASSAYPGIPNILSGGWKFATASLRFPLKLGAFADESKPTDCGKNWNVNRFTDRRAREKAVLRLLGRAPFFVGNFLWPALLF